jgi:hypothetical protein
VTGFSVEPGALRRPPPLDRIPAPADSSGPVAAGPAPSALATGPVTGGFGPSSAVALGAVAAAAAARLAALADAADELVRLAAAAADGYERADQEAAVRIRAAIGALGAA